MATRYPHETTLPTRRGSSTAVLDHVPPSPSKVAEHEHMFYPPASLAVRLRLIVRIGNSPTVVLTRPFPSEAT